MKFCPCNSVSVIVTEVAVCWQFCTRHLTMAGRTASVGEFTMRFSRTPSPKHLPVACVFHWQVGEGISVASVPERQWEGAQTTCGFACM